MEHRYPILLVGASTYMAAVEAALQTEPGLLVRRMTAIPGETSRYQAMLVDTHIPLEEVQAAAAAHPGLPIFRLDWSKSRVTMLMTEEHVLDDAAGLAQIIQAKCQDPQPTPPALPATLPPSKRPPGSLTGSRKI